MSGVWHKGYGGFYRVGKWSVSLLFDKRERSYEPLTERYGTTRTWRLGPLAVRRHGHLYGSENRIDSFSVEDCVFIDAEVVEVSE